MTCVYFHLVKTPSSLPGPPSTLSRGETKLVLFLPFHDEKWLSRTNGEENISSPDQLRHLPPPLPPPVPFFWKKGEEEKNRLLNRMATADRRNRRMEERESRKGWFCQGGKFSPVIDTGAFSLRWKFLCLSVAWRRRQ